MMTDKLGECEGQLGYALSAAEQVTRDEKLAARVASVLVKLLEGVVPQQELDKLLYVKNSSYLTRLELGRLVHAVHSGQYAITKRKNKVGSCDGNPDLFESWFVERTTECIGNELSLLRKDPSFKGEHSDNMGICP